MKKMNIGEKLHSSIYVQLIIWFFFTMWSKHICDYSSYILEE